MTSVARKTPPPACHQCGGPLGSQHATVRIVVQVCGPRCEGDCRAGELPNHHWAPPDVLIDDTDPETRREHQREWQQGYNYNKGQ
jgi:hypothetical protein